jgi:hypothetical protein
MGETDPHPFLPTSRRLSLARLLPVLARVPARAAPLVLGPLLLARRSAARRRFGPAPAPPLFVLFMLFMQ